jgi:hypothetical protein
MYAYVETMFGIEKQIVFSLDVWIANISLIRFIPIFISYLPSVRGQLAGAVQEAVVRHKIPQQRLEIQLWKLETAM